MSLAPEHADFQPSKVEFNQILLVASSSPKQTQPASRHARMLVRSCWRRAIAKVAPVSATFTRDISQTDSAAQTSTSYTGVVAAATVAAVFATHPRQSALEEEVVEKHGPPADALPADASLAWRRRYFFKYERRLREGSTPQRIYSYFANNHNGVHALPKSHVDDYVMNASDVMRSLYSVYPHGVGGSPIVRNGWFRGEDLVRGQLSVNDAFVKEDARMEAVVQKLRNEQRRAGGKGRAKKSDILQALADADEALRVASDIGCRTPTGRPG